MVGGKEVKADDMNGGTKMVVIDNDDGLIIQHPDTLVSPSRIAESVSCTRRAVLSERSRGLGEVGVALVQGSMVHELLQGLCEDEFDWDPNRKVVGIVGNKDGWGDGQLQLWLYRYNQNIYVGIR